jgi:hypothetical protein
MALCRSGLLLPLNAKPSSCVAQAEDCAPHREGMFVLRGNSWQAKCEEQRNRVSCHIEGDWPNDQSMSGG